MKVWVMCSYQLHNPQFDIAYLTFTMREKVWDKLEKVWDMSLFIPTLSDQSNQLAVT